MTIKKPRLNAASRSAETEHRIKAQPSYALCNARIIPLNSYIAHCDNTQPEKKNEREVEDKNQRSARRQQIQRRVPDTTNPANEVKGINILSKRSEAESSYEYWSQHTQIHRNKWGFCEKVLTSKGINNFKDWLWYKGKGGRGKPS